jgi:hypothetical protein
MRALFAQRSRFEAQARSLLGNLCICDDLGDRQLAIGWATGARPGDLSQMWGCALGLGDDAEVVAACGRRVRLRRDLFFSSVRERLYATRWSKANACSHGETLVWKVPYLPKYLRAV